MGMRTISQRRLCTRGLSIRWRRITLRFGVSWWSRSAGNYQIYYKSIQTHPQYLHLRRRYIELWNIFFLKQTL